MLKRILVWLKQMGVEFDTVSREEAMEHVAAAQTIYKVTVTETKSVKVEKI